MNMKRAGAKATPELTSKTTKVPSQALMRSRLKQPDGVDLKLMSQQNQLPVGWLAQTTDAQSE
jgi:hypothetical protein